MVIVSLLLSNDVFASHYRAGEITYSCISSSGKTYQIIVNTYTDPNSPADINTQSIQVSFGDFSSTTVLRSSREDVYLSNLKVSYIVKNIYIVTHTYTTNGDFKISVTDQNRVDGILNINAGDTKNIAFYIETQLHISSFTGADRSPVLLIPPVDRGCGGFKYVYNPGAYDPDGDSLYFELVTPLQGLSSNVPAYSLPSPNFTINHRTGQIIWNTPPIVTSSLAFTYNIAIAVTQWRGNIKMGFVERDMQIRIENCVNSPPVIDPMPDYCIEAGQSITPPINLRATDPNTNQTITLVGYGAPFTSSLTKYVATLNPKTPVGNPVVAQAYWKTDCSNIRYESYPLFIKATDNYAIPLSDYNYSFIRVIGPAPKNVNIIQIRNGFRITWQRDQCQLARYYKIYKRIDSSYWIPDHCYRGVDPTKYIFIDSVNVQNNPNDTSYYDDNKGEGLSPLINNCYRVVAVYPPRDSDGHILFGKTCDSYASEEVCGEIIRSKPIITNVSVNNTSINQGSIYLHWLKPIILDTINYPPPYHIVLKRATSSNGIYFPFDSMSYTSFGNITDSSYIDTLINTFQNQYYYKIDFNSAKIGNFQFIDESPIASSIKANIYSTDRQNILSWSFKVPWTNRQFIIYRKNELSNNFDSIGYSINNIFKDTGLINGTNYCYQIRSVGDYSQFLYNTILENFSQQICGIPIDTIKPCAPLLSIIPPCNSFNDFQNSLNWVPITECSGDVIYYKIYFKRLKTDSYVFLDSVGKNVFEYIDNRPELKSSIAGCYVVTGVDSSVNHNESFFTNEVCIDNCPEYRLPNVFTPNRDGKNDLLNPFPYRFVDKIDIIIFDRWGLPVFKTTNLDINWDGKDQDSKTDCTDGVYFYICDIYEIFLEGVKKRTIRGTVQIIR